MAAASGGKSNALQIVIQATDNASGELKRTTSLVEGIGKAASNAISPITGLGKSLVSAVSPAVGVLSQLGGSIVGLTPIVGGLLTPLLRLFGGITSGFSQLNGTIQFFQNNAVLKTAFNDILAAADDEVLKLDGSLSELLGTVGEIGGALAKGATPGFLKMEKVGANSFKILGIDLTRFISKLNDIAIAVIPGFAQIQQVGAKTASALGIDFGKIVKQINLQLNSALSSSIARAIPGLDQIEQVRKAAARLGLDLSKLGPQLGGALNQGDILPVKILQAQIETALSSGIKGSIGTIDLPDIGLQLLRKSVPGFEQLEKTAAALAAKIGLDFNDIGAKLTESFQQINFADLGTKAGQGLKAIFSPSNLAGVKTQLGEVFKQVDVFDLSTKLSPVFAKLQTLATQAGTEIGAGFSRLTSFALETGSALNQVRVSATKIAADLGIDFGKIGKSLADGLRNALDVTGLAGFAAKLGSGLAQALSQIDVGGFIGRILEQALPGFSKIQQFGTAIAKELGIDFAQIGADLGSSLTSATNRAIPGFAQLSGMSNRLGIDFAELGPKLGSALNLVDVAIDKVMIKAERIPKRIAGIAGGIANASGAIAGFGEPLEIFEKIRGAVGATTASMFNLTQEIGLFSSGLQAVQQLVATGPFRMLIQQNVELQEQLLSTKASLVSTNQISMGGQVIKDPTAAIKALETPVNEAINRLRATSLDLVGVTSKDLVPVFQLVAGFSSQIGINLSQASDLTASFAASFSTIGLPLGQARQEVSSILTQSIDMNSVLAKSLGITNQQVGIWKSQGRVFQELSIRLEAFRAGNALAAQTINGVFSNIQEIVDEVGRLAGEQLLQPIVDQLNVVYDYLKQNKDALAAYVSEITSTIFDGVQSAMSALGVAFNATDDILSKIPLYLAQSFANFLTKASEAVKSFITVAQPLLTVFSNLAQAASPLAGPFLQLYLTSKVAQIGVTTLAGGFGTLANLLPGVGELMFFLTGRGNSTIKMFAGLKGELGLGAAAFLVLGKNLASVPGAAGALAKQIPIFGTALAGLTPTISTFLIRLVGLNKAYPQVGAGLQTVIGTLLKLPGPLQGLAPLIGLSSKLAPLVDKYLPGMGSQLTDAATKLTTFTATTVASELATSKFKSLLEQAGAFAAKSALKYSLIGIGIYTAIQVLDKFLLKNKEVQEVLGAVFSGIGGLLNGAFEGITTAIATVIDTIGGFINGLKEMVGWVDKTSEKAKSTGETINDFLTNPIVLATAAIVGLVAAGEKIAVIQTTLATFQLAGMAAGAVQASVGFQALKIAMTQGTAASARYLATNGINVLTLELQKKALWENAAATKALMIEQIKAAVTSARTFVARTLETIASLYKVVAANVAAAFSYIFLGKSASGAGDALTIAAVKAKIASFWSTVLAPAAASAGGGLMTMATAAWEAAAGMAALAAPLIIVGGLLAIAGLGLYTVGMAKAAEGAEVLAQQTQFMSDRNLALAQSLKKAQTAQAEKTKAGIRLTDAEYEANKKLSNQAKLLIKDNEDQIAALNAQKDERGANKGQYEALIKQLESDNKMLKLQMENVQISAKELPRLGTAYEQFGNEVNTALEAIRNPAGDSEKYKEQAGKLLEGTQAQLKANLVTADEAIERYSLLATNAGLDKETQLKAEQAITEARKVQGERRVEDVVEQENKIKTLKETGNVSEAEGDRQITKLKKQELDLQLENLKKAKADADKIRVDDLNKQMAEADLEIANALKAIAAGKGDPTARREVNNQQQRDLEAEGVKTRETIAQTEADLKQIEDESKGKRGKDADEATRKAAELRSRITELNRSLGTTENKISDLVKESKNPVSEGTVDDAAVKAGEEALKKGQIRRATLEKNFQTQNAESARQFNNDKSKNDNEQAKNDAQSFKDAYDQKLKFQDEAQKILDEKFAEKKVTEQEYNDQSITNTINKLNVELTENYRQKKLLKANDKEGMHKLEAQEADINKRRLEAEEKFYQKRVEIGVRHQEILQSVLEGSFAKGQVTEEAFASESLENTQTRLNLEVGEIERQRKQIEEIAKKRKTTSKEEKAADEENLLKLAAKDGEIQKKRVDALEKYVQQRTAILERAEKKALDIAQLAEVERDSQLQELRNKNLIQDEEANEVQAKSQGERLTAELTAEEDFAAQIERLPKISDPQKESERQAQIRAARLKTAETTKSILENEAKQQETHVKLLQALVDRALKDKLNGIEAEKQRIQQVLDLQSTLTDALEFQNKILETRKELEKSIGDYVSAEYALAASLTENAKDKDRIEKKAAKSRLDFLARQQQLERDSLENDIRKNQLLLEREKIQLRLDKASLMAERADKEAELEKVLADPKATTRQKRAAQLSVDAVGIKEDALGYKETVLGDDDLRLKDEEKSRRRILAIKQEQDYDQARADYFTKMGDKAGLANLAREVENKADAGVGGFNEVVNTPDRNYTSPSYEEYLKKKGRTVPNLDTPIGPALQDPGAGPAQTIEEERADIRRRMEAMAGLVPSAPTIAAPPPPNLTRPGISPDAGAAQGNTQLTDTLTRLTDYLTNSNAGNTVTMKNSINNYITGADSTNGNTADAVGQQILNKLYDVGKLAKTRRS